MGSHSSHVPAMNKERLVIVVAIIPHRLLQCQYGTSLLGNTCTTETENILIQRASVVIHLLFQYLHQYAINYGCFKKPLIISSLYFIDPGRGEIGVIPC